MTKATRRQVSQIYFGRCAQEWIAKWGRFAAERMVREACEYGECLRPDDVTTIMEIADGVRVA